MEVMAEDSLTDKQLRFVDEYLYDLNATQAAIRAGYSEDSAKQIAHELMCKAHVQEAIAAAQAERAERMKITQDMVIEELKLIGFGSAGNVMNWTTDGVSLIPKDAMPEEHQRFIESIAESPSEYGTALKITTLAGHKVKALELLGKHLGMFRDSNQQKPQKTIQLAYSFDEKEQKS